MQFNKILKDELTYRGICVKDFAKKCNIPYRTFIGYLSKEKNKPSVESLYIISKNLNVTMEYLITGDPKDNFIADVDIFSKELISLPPPLFKKIVSFIHLLYEMNKR